jgi:hypothetical protein
VGADPRVDHDAVHPGAKIGARIERTETRPRLGERLLNQILRIEDVPRITTSRARSNPARSGNTSRSNTKTTEANARESD